MVTKYHFYIKIQCYSTNYMYLYLFFQASFNYHNLAAQAHHGSSNNNGLFNECSMTAAAAANYYYNTASNWNTPASDYKIIWTFTTSIHTVLHFTSKCVRFCFSGSFLQFILYQTNSIFCQWSQNITTFRFVKHLKMPVWSSVLWKITI